jgi:hypothetical protein
LTVVTEAAEAIRTVRKTGPMVLAEAEVAEGTALRLEVVLVS